VDNVMQHFFCKINRLSSGEIIMKIG